MLRKSHLDVPYLHADLLTMTSCGYKLTGYLIGTSIFLCLRWHHASDRYATLSSAYHLIVPSEDPVVDAG